MQFTSSVQLNTLRLECIRLGTDCPRIPLIRTHMQKRWQNIIIIIIAVKEEEKENCWWLTLVLNCFCPGLAVINGREGNHCRQLMWTEEGRGERIFSNSSGINCDWLPDDYDGRRRGQGAIKKLLMIYRTRIWVALTDRLLDGTGT